MMNKLSVSSANPLNGKSVRKPDLRKFDDRVRDTVRTQRGWFAALAKDAARHVQRLDEVAAGPLQTREPQPQPQERKAKDSSSQ